MRNLPGWILITLFTGVAILIALPLLGGQNFYSDDLAGHVALVLRMAAVGGDPWFYDRAWFGGFPAFEFYGFLPHWIAAQLLGWSDGGWVEATKAVHAVMFLSLALLPAVMWCFVRAWKAGDTGSPWVTAGGAVLVLAVVLTVMEPHTPAGLRYLVTSGVFGQLPGWVAMFAYLALVGRGWQRGRAAGLLPALAFSVLMATHPLTAAAALMVAVILLLSHANWKLALVHGAVMIVTSAWFWVPVVAWSGDFGAGTPYSGDATSLAVLFDGWLDLMNGLTVSVWALLAELVIALFLVFALVSFMRHPSAEAGAVLLLLFAALLLSGPELVEAFALGLHYDRLVVSITLVAAVLAPAAFAAGTSGWPRPAAAATGGVLLLLGAQVALNQLQTQPWLSSKSLDGYLEENWLLEELSPIGAGGRVYFEYAKQRTTEEIEPGKFVESRLWSRSGIETVNGVLIQSSRPYQLYTTLAARLEGHGFGVPPTAWSYFSLDDEAIIDVFGRNSVTHVVSANERFGERLSGIRNLEPVGGAGRYRIFAVETPRPRLRAVRAPVIGYVDFKGNLPFHFIDLFSETRNSISGSIRLVSLDAGEIANTPVDGLILNTENEAGEMAWRELDLGNGRKVPVLAIDFEPEPLPRRLERTDHRERRQYRQVAEYFWASPFERLVNAFGAAWDQTPTAGGGSAHFEWQEEGQSVQFDGLSPDRWYEFAYSAFPAWRMEGALLYRGSAGHWMIRPSGSSATARYDRWSVGAIINGWLTSFLGVLVVAVVRYRWPAFEFG